MSEINITKEESTTRAESLHISQIGFDIWQAIIIVKVIMKTQDDYVSSD